MQEPKFRVQLLGTGTSAGIPFLVCDCKTCTEAKNDRSLRKLRQSCIIYLENGHNILIDCGTDIRFELLKAKVDKVDAIIMSHAHADHLHGFHDMRKFAKAQKQTIPVYCDDNVVENIYRKFPNDVSEKNTENSEQSSERAEKQNKWFEIHPISATESQKFNLFGLEFTSLPIMHGKLPIVGYKFGNYAYITDAKTIDETTYELLKGVEILIINTLNLDIHPTHFNFLETLDAINIVKPKAAFLIHVSHDYSHAQIQEFFDDEKKKYKHTKDIPIIVAHDFMPINYEDFVNN